LFEEFVTVALREAIEGEHGGRVVGQDAATFLTRPAGLASGRTSSGTCGRPVAVADAKYRAEQPTGYPNADLYQMLAYCTALKLPRGHLIYVKGTGEALTHTVREAGIEIIGHALELDAGLALLRRARPLAPLPKPADLDQIRVRRHDRLGCLIHEYRQVA
jgi:5-methylcytosine-specific restriction enzyme subunit McrC